MTIDAIKKSKQAFLILGLFLAIAITINFFVLNFVARPFKSVFLALIVVGFGVGLGSHLIWDLFDQADVRWIPGGFLDSFWLGINGLFCLIFARSFLLFRLDSSKTKST